MSRVASVLACLLLLLLGLVPGVSLAEPSILHTERSLYRNIVVYDDGDLRCMKFKKLAGAGKQTCQNRQKPDELVLNYTRMILAALYLNPAPGRILVIGLGGGSLPKAFARLVPEAVIDVVEIDPAVTRVAQDYFSFRATDRIRVFEGDGRVFVKRSKAAGRRYDLVVLDAFDDEYVPEHMLTQEFLAEVKALLSDGGIVAANTWSTSALYDHESATYEAVFGDFYNLKLNNRVILATVGDLPSLDAIRGNAERLETALAPIGVGKAWLLPLVSAEKDWKREARVLTDQYSPSNLLNTTSRKSWWSFW